jgi:hypothetical protein
VAELILIAWGWIGAALVAAGLWAIVVGSIKASAQRKAAGR